MSKEEVKMPPLPKPARITAVQFCEDGLWFTPDQMNEYAEAYAEARVAQERERCAEIAELNAHVAESAMRDDQSVMQREMLGMVATASAIIAKVIRARYRS